MRHHWGEDLCVVVQIGPGKGHDGVRTLGESRWQGSLGLGMDQETRGFDVTRQPRSPWTVHSTAVSHIL